MVKGVERDRFTSGRDRKGIGSLAMLKEKEWSKHPTLHLRHISPPTGPA
jgi:hypothetical protein